MKLFLAIMLFFLFHVTYGQDSCVYRHTNFAYSDSVATFKNDTLSGGFYFSRHNVDSITFATLNNSYTYFFKDYVLDKILAKYNDSLIIELKLFDNMLLATYIVNSTEIEKNQILFTQDSSQQIIDYNNMIRICCISNKLGLQSFWLSMPEEKVDLYFEKTLYYSYYYLSYLAIRNTSSWTNFTPFIGLRKNWAYRGYRTMFRKGIRLKGVAYYSFMDDEFILIKNLTLGREKILVSFPALH